MKSKIDYDNAVERYFNLIDERDAAKEKGKKISTYNAQIKDISHYAKKIDQEVNNRYFTDESAIYKVGTNADKEIISAFDKIIEDIINMKTKIEMIFKNDYNKQF